jgi:hypothetical protein
MASRDISYEEAKANFIEVDGQVYKKVGSINGGGYVTVGYKNSCVLASRLIFLLHHGYIPEIVDHMDGNPKNNKITNLRASNKSTNAMNKTVRVDNKLGVKNVCWHKRIKKYAVGLSVNKKRKNIGYFDDLELAELVAIEARNKFHGEFARH